MEEKEKKAKWYILQTLSGSEYKVEKTIKEMIKKGKAKGLIEDVIVPTEKVVEMVKGQKRTSTRKFYPGYVLIKMIMTDESWYMVNQIPRVAGFIGNKTRPVPLKDSEAEFLLKLIEERQEQPRPKYDFQPGDRVTVIDGPFANFDGYIEEVNHDKGTIKVIVSIFGRSTPVELDFVQVTKTQ